MSKYPVVDLRPKLAGSPQASQGHVTRKTSITDHYNGPAVTRSAVSQLLFDAEYHIQKNWGTPQNPAYTNGVQYEAAIAQDGTRYILRNPKAILWHCANQEGNRNSRAFTFLIGEGQRITKAAQESAAELCDEWRKEDNIPRERVFSHREWSSTACPGSAHEDFTLAYRAGRIQSAPPEKSEAWSVAKYNFVSGSESWGDPRCRDAVAMINEAAGKTLAAWTKEEDRGVYASQRAYESPAPAGKLVAIAVGEQAVAKLSAQSESVFGNYDRDESDIWDARYAGEMWECMREIAKRENLPGLAAKWNKSYGGSPKGRHADDKPDLTPTPKSPVPQSPAMSREAGIIDRHFGTNYGQMIVEEADRAGLALQAACALVEQESNGRNIFGADWGTRGADRIPFAHMPVTEARVKALVAHVRAGGVSNGVGLTQLTWRDFLYEAEAMGGAHLVRNQLRVGFKLLASYFGKHGEQDGYGSYNAGEGDRASVRGTYSASCIQKSRAWRSRLGA